MGLDIGDLPGQFGLTDGAITPPKSMTRLRKAAMVVQIMLADGQKLSLSTLPEEQQIALARELGALRAVDRTTLHSVASEFAAELEDIALSAPGSMDGVLDALSGQISPATAARLREEESLRKGADPWAQVIALEPADLVPLMEKESTQICAVALSKLPVAKAAVVLGQLPGERARRIAYAVSQTSGISPEAVRRIGQTLAIDYGIQPSLAFATPPSQRVGAILNSSQSATRDSVLEALVADDPAFAELVRKSIFTFPDIAVRIAPTDIPKVVRGADNVVIVTALAAAKSEGGAMADTVDFILSNMSQRMADQMREEIAARGRVRKSDAESAQAELIAAIRTKVESGEISFVETEEDE